jgi:hypothetical protein
LAPHDGYEITGTDKWHCKSADPVDPKKLCRTHRKLPRFFRPPAAVHYEKRSGTPHCKIVAWPVFDSRNAGNASFSF